MAGISYSDASAHALGKGGTQAEIDRQAAGYVRQVGSVPFNNMIRALNMHPWSNDRAQWERLAAALQARRLARKGAR
jgi:hypothetical protein